MGEVDLPDDNAQLALIALWLWRHGGISSPGDAVARVVKWSEQERIRRFKRLVKFGGIARRSGVWEVKAIAVNDQPRSVQRGPEDK